MELLCTAKKNGILGGDFSEKENENREKVFSVPLPFAKRELLLLE